MQFNLNFLLVAVLATLSVGANACKNEGEPCSDNNECCKGRCVGGLGVSNKCSNF